MREAVRIPKLLNGYKGQKELREDVEEQLGQLFPKHFLVTVPAKAFSNYPRYVAAIVMRLEKFRDSPARDAEKTSEIHQLEVPYFRRVAELRGQKEPRLEEFFWQLQELRVSHSSCEHRSRFRLNGYKKFGIQLNIEFPPQMLDSE